MSSLASLFSNDEENKKRIAWSMARAVGDGTDMRIDCDGRTIRWSEYGKTTEYGWEIDHVQPTILGGLDNVLNVRARHWRGNRSAGGLLGQALRDIGRKTYGRQ